MSLRRKEIFEFGEFRLDVEEHTIERIDGVRNGTLTEKAFQALVLLVRRRGHLVPKDELIGFVWPDTIVEENNLEKCVHQLRHFLGETSDGSTYIETVRKHGYRFVGDVRTVEVSGTWLPETFRTDNGKSGSAGLNGDQRSVPQAESDEIDGTGSPSLSVGKARFRGKTVALALFATLLAVALAGYVVLGPSTSTVADRGKISLAVLPSKPIDPSNRDSLYEAGIADAIINSLSQVQGFEMRSLNAVRDYNGIDQDPVIAGREQKVDYVLAPNYQLAGGRIRITASLINVASGKIEDTLKFEKEATSHFAVEDAVAASFGSDLMRRFARTGGGPPAKRGTDNEVAYQLYQQAMYLHDKKRSREALSKAVEYLEQAVSADPNYAQAWAGKALAHASAYGSNSDQQYQRSMEALRKALAIDPNLSEAYSALCQNKFSYEYDFAGAEAACKRAIELGPNSSIAHQIYAHFLVSRDRLEEAFATIKTAIDLDPASYFNKRFYANGLYSARRYDEAISEYKQQIELNPTNIGTYNWIIRALEAQGNEPEAFEWFIRSLTLQESDQKTIQRFRDAYRISGWRGVLLERIKTPEIDRGSSSDFRLAGLYARVGNKDKAFEYLEKSYLRRHVLFTMLQTEPQLDSIRDDPRYADLVRRIEGKGV
ncbi:MAG TPA: winged helix-turn-helix domain-containing protein [Pyrinomonadaceae bacterium]|nr:winged helix-turn-helix domain-containing protein [Pyrinomonadaceae bacterium]